MVILPNLSDSFTSFGKSSSTLILSNFYFLNCAYVERRQAQADSEEVRTPSEKLITGNKSWPAQDRSCINHQVKASLTPLIESQTFKKGSSIETPSTYGAMSTYVNNTWPSYNHDFSSNFYFAIIAGKRYMLTQGAGVYYYKCSSKSTGLGTLYIATVVPWVREGYYKIYYEIISHGTSYLISYNASMKVSTVTGSYTVKQLINITSAHSDFAALHAAYHTVTADPCGYGSSFYVDPSLWVAASSQYTDSTTYDPRALNPLYRDLAVNACESALLYAKLLALRPEINPHNISWGELAVDAVNNIQMTDVNTIAFIKDLRKTFGELKIIAQLYSNPTNVKKWSELWLSFRYGTQLTWADFQDLVASVRRGFRETKKRTKMFQFSRSMRSESFTSPLIGLALSYDRDIRYKLYFTPKHSRFKDCMSMLYRWGLFPTFENVWDIIPLSFTVDWVVDVQNQLAKIDALAYEDLINVLGVTYSYKDTIMLPLSLNAFGFEDTTAEVTFYHRSKALSLHRDALTLQWGSGGAINIVDAITLILARK